MLTRKQYELLRFINERLKEAGVPPSFDEMKDALDLRSKSGIHRLITALEERGFIRRLPNRARAIEVIKLPELAGANSNGRRGFTPSVIEGNRYEWKAGDLMLTAPGWAIHNHSSKDEDVYELTIQDSPLHIGMGSLLWQEDLKRPARALGAEAGFATNRGPS